MTFTEEQVAAIVFEVIRRLGLQEGAPRVAVVDCRSAGTDLVLTEKVITLRSVEGRLTGVTRLLVNPRAVVTPVVRDELKQRQIALVRQA